MVTEDSLMKMCVLKTFVCEHKCKDQRGSCMFNAIQVVILKCLEYSGDYWYNLLNRRYVGQDNCGVKFPYRPVQREAFDILK